MATLPGIVDAALAMPDIHQGYGFPVGGVAATEPPDGVVSPGGVGYDINCGVRLLVAAADRAASSALGASRSCTRSRARVPVGAGHGGSLRLTGAELDRVLVRGPAIARRRARHRHPRRTSSAPSRRAACAGADPAAVSERARARGAGQLGTLGSGNHFIELQRVERVLDPVAAEAFGLRQEQVTVLIHSGSRGLGHQVCTDYVQRDGRASSAATGSRCPTASSPARRSPRPEGRAYLAAMAAAANFAWANRQAIAHARPPGDRRRSSDSEVARRHAPGLRRRAQRRQARAPRGPRAVRSPQGRDPGVPGRLARDPRRLPRGRAAGVHPRQHGHEQLRAGRAARAPWRARSGPPATAPAGG